MSTQTSLFALAPAIPETAARPSRETTNPAQSPVDQVRKAFSPQRRLSAILGFILGGFVPVATYTLVHGESVLHPAMWVLILGGLAYSAVSVFTWAQQVFEMPTKALGFVVLTEGAVTFSHTTWLSVAGLLILITINGICATVALQSKR